MKDAEAPWGGLFLPLKKLAIDVRLLMFELLISVFCCSRVGRVLPWLGARLVVKVLSMEVSGLIGQELLIWAMGRETALYSLTGEGGTII